MMSSKKKRFSWQLHHENLCLENYIKKWNKIEYKTSPWSSFRRTHLVSSKKAQQSKTTPINHPSSQPSNHSSVQPPP